MTLVVENPRADQLAEELAALRGRPVAEVVVAALESELARARQPHAITSDLRAIARRFAALPVRDARSDDDILAYDDRGLPR